jgi:polysaccharide deacetylase 2 family uncharacterized protein YibQ
MPRSRRFKLPKASLNPKTKMILWGLALTGLAVFLVKDFMFRKPDPAPVAIPLKSEQRLESKVSVKKDSPKPVKKIVPEKEKSKKAQAPQPKSSVFPFFPKKAVSVEKSPPSLALGGPKMAIILDDWGQNFSLLQYALEIRRPLTLAILPNLPHSHTIAEEAFRNKLGVMLHMPMQPKSGRQDLEPHTILTTMPDGDIVRYLNEALLSVPYAEGVNNHMGSAATSDLRVMRTVIRHLKSKNLFFIDSNVIATTKAPQAAKEAKIRFTQRDVFIDNEMNLAAIRLKLRQAKEIAKSKGEVVVIGHDKKMTLQAIKELVPEIEKEGVRLVLAKELLR